jgi:hypothetical protein
MYFTGFTEIFVFFSAEKILYICLAAKTTLLLLFYFSTGSIARRARGSENFLAARARWLGWRR